MTEGTADLIELARRGDAAGLTAALDGGGDLDVRDRWGQGLLHHAAAKGAEDCVALLLSRGAAVNATSDAGNAPLMVAAANGQVGVVRKLLAEGADPAQSNKWGMGADHWAQWSPAVDEIRALLAGRLA